VRLHPSLARLYREKVAALQSLLTDEETRTEAVEIIRTLIERIVLWPSEGGGVEVELVGEIAAMVQIGLADNKKAAPGGAAFADRLSRSVKVDAGAGFEPATFRL
jgi:site-specific DNA recombinase